MVKNIDKEQLKIVVTGGDGQLGRTFRKIAEEYPAWNFTFLGSKELDITEPEMVARMMEEQKPDVIINCAAYTAVDKAEEEPQIAETINRYGVGLLAEAAQKDGVKLIHFSTDYLFGDAVVGGERPFTEDDEPTPQTVYGATKREGERIVELVGGDTVVLRTAWLYSEFGANFVKTMLRLGKSGNPVRVVADQCGTPTYAEDLARAALYLLEQGFEGYNLYHYTNAGETTWCGFAEEIFKLSGLDVELTAITTEEYPTAAKRPKYSVLSKDKIAAMGVEVPQWQDSLKRCLTELSKRGEE